MKSLIADDDASSRVLLHTFLSQYGECHMAENGQQAVEAVSSAREGHHRFDLVCMDLVMPEMDGAEAIRLIRKREEEAGIFSRRVKIIVTTGEAGVEHITEAFRGNCEAYLLKPVDTGRLRAELETLGLVR